MAHTPGPWWYDKQTESIGCASGWLGRVQHTQKADPPFGNPDDDGQLMAVVPELLKACEMIVRAEAAATEENNYQLLVEATELARAAIAKVRGE